MAPLPPGGLLCGLAGRRATPELLASRGDVLLSDRRLWHSRSRNVSSVTRKVLFISYTYRWIRPLDPMPFDETSPLWDASAPAQRQLLDAADFWGIHNGGGLNDTIPLRAELLSHGLLDRTIPGFVEPCGAAAPRPTTRQGDIRHHDSPSTVGCLFTMAGIRRRYGPAAATIMT